MQDEKTLVKAAPLLNPQKCGLPKIEVWSAKHSSSKAVREACSSAHSGISIHILEKIDGSNLTFRVEPGGSTLSFLNKDTLLTQADIERNTHWRSTAEQLEHEANAVHAVHAGEAQAQWERAAISFGDGPLMAL